MANNNIIFNAAIQGATGGISASRWLVDENAADYSAIQEQLIIFATAVDNEIPTDAALTDADGELMQCICSQVVNSRWFLNLALPTAQAIARSIKALWTEIKTEMLPVAGGGISPLGGIWYVDINAPGTTPDGSIANPFELIQDAVDVAADGDIIYVVPGNYSGTVSDVTIVGKSLTIVGMSHESVSQNLLGSWLGPDRITSDSVLYIYNMGDIGRGNNGDGVTNVADTVLIETSSRKVNLTGANLYLHGSSAELNQVEFLNMPGCALFATGYKIGGLQISGIGTMSCNGCVFPDNAQDPTIHFTPFTGAELCSFFNCQVQNSIGMSAPAGGTTFVMDETSYASFTSKGTTFTHIIPRPTSGGKVTKNITVPAIAASGQLAYLDVDLTNTALGAVHNSGNDGFDHIVAMPTADLSASGVGRGAYLNCRSTSTPGIVRLAFHGILAGGAVDFVFNKVGPSGVPFVTA